MGWLGDEYFQAYPGEADWRRPDGRMVSREWLLRDFDHFGAGCRISRGQDMGFCITHWMALYGPRANPALPEALPCGHCSETFPSRKTQKEHMQRAHKDILQQQRAAYFAKRGQDG